MASFLKASEAERGELVTTYSPYGGVSLGRLVAGVVYVSGGNGFYYPVDAGYRHERDRGAGYSRATRSLFYRRTN